MEDIMIDFPVSPTLLRVVRVFRIGRILRLIKVIIHFFSFGLQNVFGILYLVGGQRYKKIVIRIGRLVAGII